MRLQHVHTVPSTYHRVASRVRRMRALRGIVEGDFEKGYMDLLSQLTHAPAVSQDVFRGANDDDTML